MAASILLLLGTVASGVASAAGAVGGAVAGAAGAAAGAVGGAAGAVGGALGSVGGALASGASAVGSGLASAASGVGGALSSAAGSVGGVLSNAAGAVGQAAGSVGQGIVQGAGQIGNTIAQGAQAVGQGVQGAAQGVGNALQGAGQSVGQFASQAGETLANAAQGVGESLQGAGQQVVNGAQQLGQYAQQGVSKIGDAASSVGDMLTGGGGAQPGNGGAQTSNAGSFQDAMKLVQQGGGGAQQQQEEQQPVAVAPSAPAASSSDVLAAMGPGSQIAPQAAAPVAAAPSPVAATEPRPDYSGFGNRLLTAYLGPDSEKLSSNERYFGAAQGLGKALSAGFQGYQSGTVVRGGSLLETGRPYTDSTMQRNRVRDFQGSIDRQLENPNLSAEDRERLEYMRASGSYVRPSKPAKTRALRAPGTETIYDRETDSEQEYRVTYNQDGSVAGREAIGDAKPRSTKTGGEGGLSTSMQRFNDAIDEDRDWLSGMTDEEARATLGDAMYNPDVAARIQNATKRKYKGDEERAAFNRRLDELRRPPKKEKPKDDEEGTFWEGIQGGIGKLFTRESATAQPVPPPAPKRGGRVMVWE